MGEVGLSIITKFYLIFERVADQLSEVELLGNDINGIVLFPKFGAEVSPEMFGRRTINHRFAPKK